MKISDAALGDRVRLWQQRLAPLGVAQWRIEKIIIGGTAPSGSEDAHASAGVSSSYESVRFFFDDTFIAGCSRNELDETIVHEWLHVFGRDLDEVRERVKRWMPEMTFEDYTDTYTHAREGEIDRLARFIVYLFNHEHA